MSATTASQSISLVDAAQIVGGFATLGAALLGTIALPIAFFEARRHKELARLDRVSAAVQSYVERRVELQASSYMVYDESGDEFIHVFEHYDRRDNLEDSVRILQFTIRRLAEIGGPKWIEENRSFVGLLDQDLREIDWNIAFEIIGTWMCSQACQTALTELADVECNKAYSWDDRFEPTDGYYAPRATRHPELSDEDWDDYITTEEYAVRTKRRLLSAIHSQKSARRKRQELTKIVDAARSELKLEPIGRHPGDDADINAESENANAPL